MDPKTGDKVKITTSDSSFEGILMPRPELLPGQCTVLKLDSGYNIGIDPQKINTIEVIEEYKEKKESSEQSPTPNPQLPTVSILSLGGTISSKVDYRSGGTHADYTAKDFVSMLPELTSAANLRAKKVMSVMSEHMSPTDWQEMAKAIATELNDQEVSGVVVTQGTDTLHYSTAALSFMLGKLPKPVVFTASQRSIDRGSSDAFMNITCAVHAAMGDIAEVMTCLHGTTSDEHCLLIRGTKVRKMHTSRRDAFRPINELPFATITPQGKLTVINDNYHKRSQDKMKVIPQFNFEQKTGLLYVYPGMNPAQFNVFIEKKYRGLVIAATALGHVPAQVVEKIKHLTSNGCVVVIASQTIYGRVHPHVYTNLRKLSIECDVVFAEDTLPEVAYTKLGWLLGSDKGANDIKKIMTMNMAGEITDRTDPKSFMY